MDNTKKAFQVTANGKSFDYRLGKTLDLDAVRIFFEKKGYKVAVLTNAGRHVVGELQKNYIDYFLKLALSSGISILTENEFRWNQEYNLKSKSDRFIVPQNIESGFYQDGFFYLITSSLMGQTVNENDYPSIIEFSEHIQSLRIKLRPYDETAEGKVHSLWFTEKTKRWLEAIPKDIVNLYKLYELFDFINLHASRLAPSPRHGDFTPWHMMKLINGSIALIDGEHALQNGVENYDIAYFIQRIFSVDKNPKQATKIYELLVKKGYDKNKLKVVLAARAIGGFLDESLSEKPNFGPHEAFSKFVRQIPLEK